MVIQLQILIDVDLEMISEMDIKAFGDYYTKIIEERIRRDEQEALLHMVSAQGTSKDLAQAFREIRGKLNLDMEKADEVINEEAFSKAQSFFQSIRPGMG